VTACSSLCGGGAASRYRVVLTGEGTGVTQRTEMNGIIRAGRFLPLESLNVGTVRGHENRSSVKYDYERGTVEFHSVSYTLILGRRRQVDDVLKLPVGQPIDDLASATLNFAANRLEQEAAGYYRTAIVRRAKAENVAGRRGEAGGGRLQQPVEEVLWVMKRWISRRNEARDRRRPGGPPRIAQRSAGAKDALQRPNDFFNGLLGRVARSIAAGRRCGPGSAA